MIYVAFGVSGVSALVYQVAWQRIRALQSGVGIYSVAVVVAAFLSGIGVGAALVMTWDRQVNAIVPFGLAGETSTIMELEVNGQRSNARVLDPHAEFRLRRGEPAYLTLRGAPAAESPLVTQLWL